jgi:hypothetical protein
MSEYDYREELQLLFDAAESFAEPALGRHYPWATALDRTRAALEAQPDPVAPTDEDLEDLAEVMNVSGNPVPAMRRALELWGRSTPHPPADGEVAELAAELRHFIAGYQQMRGLDPEHVYSIHRGDAMEAHLRISRLSRTAELLERRANALPTPEATNV